MGRCPIAHWGNWPPREFAALAQLADRPAKPALCLVQKMGQTLGEGHSCRSVVPQGRKLAGLVKGSEDEVPEPPALNRVPPASRFADEPEIRATSEN